MKTRIPPAAIAAAAILTGWAGVLAVSIASGQPTPLDTRPPPAARWVVVRTPPSAPAARDWTHFLACSGLTADPELMRATLILNRGGDESIWRGPERRDVAVRVALAPVTGTLTPQAEKIISDAPGAVADCGETP